MPLSPRLVAVLGVIGLVACGKNAAGPDAALPECSDGIDNDGDGMIDFPDDLGCTSPTDNSEDSPPLPQCSDGRDNDGDGKIDYPNDPGCIAPEADSEVDDCPSGPNCPQCSNGIDDDGNGLTDYPADTAGCTSAADNDEFDPTACGTGLVIKPLPATMMDNGTLGTASVSMISSPCGGGSGSPAIAYELHLTEPKVVVASTDGSSVDTVLDVRSAMCMDVASEQACNNDIDGTNTASSVTVSLLAGIHYIIVEGHDSTVTGPYLLNVQLFAGEGTACTLPTDCGPGLVCRIPLNGTMKVCSKPECSDGVDDDGDGKNDYPDDPGCSSPDDNDETDTCPHGATCPACSNGIDDDGDGLIDYPADPSCTSAAGNSEACSGEQDPILDITSGTTTGTLVGAHDDETPSCGEAGGNDLLFTLTLPAMHYVTIDTDGSPTDTLLSLLPPSCQQPDLGCDDDGGTPFGASLLTVNNLAAGTYIVALDTYSFGTPGPFTLHVSGELAPGASCEPAATFNGALTCPSASPCGGPAGSKICVPALCSDGLDNDGDGKIDFPDDPGCATPDDNSEVDSCPGAGCPACANGTDNDGDGHIDYAQDLSCYAASATNEAFCNVEHDRVMLVSGPSLDGDTTNAHDDFPSSTCQSDTTGPDVTYELILPVAVATLDIDTVGSVFDTVLTLRPVACGADTQCDDDGEAPQSLLSLTNIAAGSYAIVVDGFAGDSGAYQLHVHGTAAAGKACTSALFTENVLTCATGLMCTAGTCQ